MLILILYGIQKIFPEIKSVFETNKYKLAFIFNEEIKNCGI